MVEMKKLLGVAAPAQGAATKDAKEATAEEGGLSEVEQLVVAVEALERAVGADAPMACALRDKLAEARRRRDDAKPLRSQVLALERKMDKRRKAAVAASARAGELAAAAVVAKTAATMAAEAAG